MQVKIVLKRNLSVIGEGIINIWPDKWPRERKLTQTEDREFELVPETDEAIKEQICKAILEMEKLCNGHGTIRCHIELLEDPR